MSHAFRKSLIPLSKHLIWLHRRLLPNSSWAGWTPYLWLLYLGFFFVRWPGSMPWDLAKWILSIAAAVVFLILYFRSYNCSQRNLGGILVGIATLGYVFVFYTGTGHTFVIFAAALTAHYRNLRKSVMAIILILGGFGIEATVLHFMPDAAFAHSVWFWLPTLMIGGIIGLANAWFADDEAKRRTIEESQEEIRRLAATAERERIARDLHDLLGHTLTLITVKSELAAKLAERDMTRAAREIREVERISRETLQQVREAVGGYRSGGLTGEIINARIALGTANISLETSGEIFKLPASHDQLLALVLREATTNVVRHSEARSCSIRMETVNGIADLYVTDDGRGGAFKEGHGIRGMRERLQIMNGHLDIRSQTSGTALHASLPIEPSVRSSVEPIPPAILASASS